MPRLEPTPELIATARRVATRTWTVGPEGAAGMLHDGHLEQLVIAGLAVLHYTPAHQMRDDYWRLTPAGEQWLANATTDDTEKG
jgi:hypothetical protein